MNRGDVVRVDLPAPKGKPGHEQVGERPAVIVQDAAIITANPSTVVVVPLTSKQAALRFPQAFLIKKTADNGLDVDSVALTHQIRAVDQARVLRTVGKLSDEVIKELDDHLRRILSL
ncbi:MAG: type II toxin-antitoxin system PemK/MazF family toxin [Planctomycetia bacterium]|nr:type II toxin-antitoxin system PemK/MazF family toxin [Planctomycetia bacterium]